jgi:hypothetical protein
MEILVFWHELVFLGRFSGRVQHLLEAEFTSGACGITAINRLETRSSQRAILRVSTARNAAFMV